jgi:hypothetical protein
VIEEISIGSKSIKEESEFKVRELIYPDDAMVIASYKKIPLSLEMNAGNGKLTVLASEFGISPNPGNKENPGIDKNMRSPFPFLSHVEFIISEILNSTKIFNGIDGLSMITCRKYKGDYTLAISNNSWSEKPFRITSSIGKILNITELQIDCSERKATGFLPESVTHDAGKNSAKTIAGGDIRIFNVKIDEENIEEMPFIQPVANPVNRGLPLRNLSSVKREILLRPTFFQHFDRIMIDWKYLAGKEISAIRQESVWIKNQGLKIIVDLSSGINLFPDLRLVSNDSTEFIRSIEIIRSVIDKMSLLGADDLILTAHRTIENNFTEDEFSASLKSTLKSICQLAEGKGINVHLRMVTGKYSSNPEQAMELQLSVNEPNFYIAPSLAMLSGDTENLNKHIGIMKDLKYSILFVSAPEKDIYGKLWNINLPLYKYDQMEDAGSILRKAKDKILLLDGLYVDKDEEYLDIKNLEELITKIL